MRFSFIHAADLHIDSPLAGLGLKDAAVAEKFARAGRKAVENLVDHAIADAAAFVIIAGDVFDGDWKDFSSGLFFARALGRLHREIIPTFVVKGNHDAESLMSRSLGLPDSVTVFGHAKAATSRLEHLGVAIHGRSYATRVPPAGFVASYPARHAGMLNIGVLHTALDGTRGHEAYAPCTFDELRRFDYDYWALGHVHGAARVSEAPWIVFPGNVQGRSIRETGPKGVMRVQVDDGRIVAVEPIVLDAARWAAETVDIAGCTDEAAVLARIEDVLVDAARAAGGRPLAIRLTLMGILPLHARLVAGQEQLQAEARAIAASVGDDCWVERVRIETQSPGRPVFTPDMLDMQALLEATAGEPDFDRVLDELIVSVSAKLPRELVDLFADDAVVPKLRLSARDQLLGLVAGGAADR